MKVDNPSTFKMNVHELTWSSPLKRSYIRWLAIAVAIIGIPTAVIRYIYPSYTYRYRLTINLEVDDRQRSASSVIEVNWYSHPLPEVVSFTPELRGEAALVDLGNRGVVVAALNNGDWGISHDGAWGAKWLAPRAFGYTGAVAELPDFLREHGKRDLKYNNLPRFIWLSDPKDPTTAKIVHGVDFSATIGPGVRFVSASVETTRDPLVIDIKRKLPWLYELEKQPPGRDIIYLSDGLDLSRSYLIGDRS